MTEVTPIRPSAADDADLRAADGRVPGRRGRATRQKLLDRTREMLAATAYRDVKVIDIAREAGTSPATFYQYFADVEAALLVLAEEMAHARPAPHRDHHRRVVGRVGRPRHRRSSSSTRSSQFWDEHRAVLRVMDLATDEGDGRFQHIRTRLLNDITKRWPR